MPQVRPIIIFRDHLLPSSETFIQSQGEGLTHFKPFYAGSKFVEGITLPNQRTIVVNADGWSGKPKELLFKLLGYAPKFTKKIQQVKPSLIHAHFGPDGVIALPIAANLDLPLIVTFHGYDATIKDEYARKSFFNHRLYVYRRETLKNETKLFICVSNFIKDKLLNQGFPSDRLVTHYIGVDTNLFTPDPKVERQKIVLFVGRLVEKKGCTHLLQAMKVVQERVPDIKLVIIGDGPLRSSLEEQARNSLRHCEFLGIKSPKSVQSWMNRARVLCVPSIEAESGDTEAFGIVFIEAQSMQLPVVSFASGGIPEAVKHGETGLLCPEGNWEELASHLTTMITDDDCWQYMSNQCRSFVKKNFDLGKQTKILENIYRQVIT